MNVKNIFLNRDLIEKVDMKPPFGYIHPLTNFCYLRKTLYELKQALRAYFVKFSAIISQFGFYFNSYDNALFIHKIER